MSWPFTFLSFFSYAFLFNPSDVISNNHFFYGVCFFVSSFKKSCLHGQAAQGSGRLIDLTGTHLWTGFAHPLASGQSFARIYHISSGLPSGRPLPLWCPPLPWLMKKQFLHMLFLSRPQQHTKPQQHLGSNIEVAEIYSSYHLFIIP